MKKLTKREKQVLIELLKNCRTSDQEIARRLKTSRPTIFKIRKKLEEKGLIKKYVALINFEEIGFCLQSVISYCWKDYSKTKELEKTINFIKSLPEVVLFIKSDGMGSKTNLIIAFHENLKDYEEFIRKLKYEWKNNVKNIEVFLSPINSILKDYDLSSPAIEKISEKTIKSKKSSTN